MKTTLKITAIALLLLASTAVFAGVKQNYIRLPDNATSYVSGNAMEAEGMTVVKFTDGKTTCYTIVAKINKIPASTSISCFK